MTSTPVPVGPLTARRLLCGVVAVLVLSLFGSVAWAFWTTDVTPGSRGASGAASVNPASTPSVTVSGRTVTVNWQATTLSNGAPVTGYVVKRYDANTLAPQTIGTGCQFTVTTTVCTEDRVPAGRWVYSVTATVGTNWRGQESVKSSPVTVTGPSLALSTTRVRPGTSMTGTATGFLPGETVRYRLDSPTGTELTGTLAGNPTPATVSASGGGAVSVAVPAATNDGNHAVYAVASPSGDAASAAIVVDGTPPPAPVLTQTPTNPSGDTVTFAYTEAEASATVECRLDTAAFAPCESPVGYSGLADGSHTFQARAIDTVGNVSTITSYTWTVNTTLPTVAIGFPKPNAAYNDSGFTAGCGTAATGDVCGTADDDILVATVNVSLRRLSTGLYWNGSSFSAATETWLLAIGTSDWTYGITAAALPEGDYTLRARASDGTNLGYDSRTFSVDRTTPPPPTLTSVPSNPSGTAATVEFTDSDPTAGFECRLDGGAWSSCSSPKRYTGLTDGSHTVAVRALDPAGNTSTATSTTWTGDGTPPTGAMTFPTASSYNRAGWTAGCGTPATDDICGTASDTGSGLTSVAVSIRRASTNSYWNGTTFTASSETWLTATGTSSWSYPFAGTSFPADGSYTVRWRAVDAAGNATTGGVDLTIDTTAPPAPQIVQAPPDPSGSSVQFDFTAEAQASTECRIDADAWSPCTAPVSYNNLAPGAHTFAVRATDAAGNTGVPASHTWTVDTGLPSVNIGFPNGGRSYNDDSYSAGCGTSTGDLCGTASDPQDNLAEVAVSVRRQSTGLYWDGTGFTSSDELFLPATGAAAWSYPMAASAFPAEGQYTVRARATDRAGLSATDSVSFTIDRTAPAAPTITSGPSGTTRGQDTFSFTGDAGAGFECRLDGGSWQACTSPRSMSGLADGSHTFDVRAVDQAGNAGTATSRTWTVDATAPSVVTTFPGDGGGYNNTSFDAGCVAGTGDLCGTTSDPGSGVAHVELSLQRAGAGLYLAGGTFSSASQNWITANGTTAWSYPLAATTFPADDAYILSVRATDGAGNIRTTTTTFRIDRTKPTATGFTTGNAGVVSRLDAGDTFTLTFSETMSPSSIIAGWNGTSAQNVVVRATGSGNARDKLTVYNATNTTLLPLGTINLNRTDYVQASRTFGASGTRSTITMSGNSLTITLGTPSGAVLLAAGPANATWTPDIGATDLAGNGSSTAAYTENDNDGDF